MNLYRIPLLVGLFVAVLVSFMWGDNRPGLAGASDRPSSSKQNITGADGESDSIILRLRQKLQQKEFLELNSILDDYQIASESDVSAEDRLYTAYRGFGLKDISYEPLFNEWVAATPDSYQPYLARAEFYYHMGWASRGAKWASETKKEQFERMNSYFLKAVKDIDNVLGINKRTIVPYSLLMGITMARGKDEYKAAALYKALEISPASYEIRAHYLYSIEPRWGGSFEEMKAFLIESQAHVSENPKLKLLPGIIYAEVGDTLASDRKYSVAEKQYTKALAYGESHKILKERGKNRYRQENFEDALSDLNRAIQLYPEDGKYYYWRSKTHSALGQHRRALSDIIRADKLEPHDEDIGKQIKWLAGKFERLGYELGKSGKPKEAVEQYDAALRLAPERAILYDRRARASINLHQYDAAINDLKKAIALDPREFAYYLLMDWVLAKRKDWNRIIAYWDKYIQLNPTHSRAYVERGGAYFHKGDIKSAVRNAKIAADMGNLDGKQIYEKYKHVVE